MKLDQSTYDFATAFLGSMFDNPTWQDGPVFSKDGCGMYCAHLNSKTGVLSISDDLPESDHYMLVGYCETHGIEYDTGITWG